MMCKVRNWERFQHYKDRNPPWIKLHFALLSSQDWVLLDDRSRVLAIACMLVASRNDGFVDCSDRGLAYLQRVAYLHQPPDVIPLIDAGFLEADSECKQMLATATKPQANDTQRRGEERRGRSASQGKRATSLPADFSITDDMREWARKELPQLNGALEAETGKFCDHHAAKGSAFKDWRRAWQKWMRNAAEYRRTDGIKADESHLPEHLRGFVC